MQIRKSDDLWVKQTRTGEVWSNFSGKWMIESENDRITLALRALKIARSSKISDEEKSKLKKSSNVKTKSLNRKTRFRLC